VHRVPLGAAHLPFRFAQHIDEIACALGIHRHGPGIDRPMTRREAWRDGDLRRPRSGSRFSCCPCRRCRARRRCGIVVKGEVGPHELRKLVGARRRFLRLDGIAPAEVVKPREPLQRCRPRDGVANRLVDGAAAMWIGVDVAVSAGRCRWPRRRPRRNSSTGRTTAASLGPSFAAPTSASPRFLPGPRGHTAARRTPCCRC